MPFESVPDQNKLRIDTPALTKRETAKIRLNNGVEVLLISDPETDQSAAALSISVGSWNDPTEYPGMAHFLEHMLFMGSATYAEEDGFMKYVNEHQGSVNAYTSTEHTVYMFSITNDNFKPGLNRFAHLFIDPLFSASGVGRELHAVDQEHAKNIENDDWRMWMIMKHLGNQDHPFSGFSTGNAETLGHIPREAVIEWYKEHYSGNQMHLVVYSPLPMRELKKLVASDFSPIPNFEAESQIPYQEITSTSQKGKIVYIDPVKDLRRLSLVWELPREYAVDGESKIAEVAAYALGSGSQGSLEQLLKSEQLAEKVQPSVDRLSPEHVLFSVDLTLTKKGVEDVDTVIEKCFEAINLLQKSGVPPYIFKEMQTMQKIAYRYQSRENAFSYVMRTADEMLYEDFATYPQKTRVVQSFNPQKIDALLEGLTPETCSYFVIAPASLTGVKPEHQEKWGGGKYTTKRINKTTLMAWKEADSHGALTLPRPNPFIPTHLEIVNKEAPMQANAVPTQVVRNAKGDIYYWPDTRYGVPNVSWTIQVRSPQIDGSPRSKALLDLYVRSLNEDIAPTIAQAKRGGLNVNFSYDEMKAKMVINGYSEKAPELLANCLDAMRTLRPSLDNFNVYKESLLSQYESRARNMLFVQAIEMMDHSLFSDAPTSEELVREMKTINYDEFIHFSRELFRVAYTEAMLTGNMQEETARTAWHSIEKTLAYDAYPRNEQNEKQVLVLPEDEGPFKIKAETDMLGSAALLAIEEGPFSMQHKAASFILGSALQTDFFATLRTKQQTGYIAKSWNREVQHQMFQFFGVQSSTHQPSELLSRFELFLESYVKDFGTVFPEDRFMLIKTSLLQSLKQPPTNLKEMNSYLTRLAFNRDGNFNYLSELIGAVEKLNYNDVRKFAHHVLSRENSGRLAILLEGKIQGDFRYRSATTDLLRNRGRYVTSRTERQGHKTVANH